jgi:glutamate racemase
MIVIDSGLGGIAVARALRALAPDLPFAYLADTAGFPYGSRSVEDINARAAALIRALEKVTALSTVVLACNTLSTLCLAELRAQFPYHFVGTVPAIKVAGNFSKTRRFTLLATPNTVASSYSQKLIGEFASDCVVDRYGAPNLAAYAECSLLGEIIPADVWRNELAPAFHNDAQGKTDAVILGCTHYPLVLEQLRKAAPWEVQWIDSSEAIARRALSQPVAPVAPVAYVTAEKDVARYAPLFTREGFAQTLVL